MLSFLALLIACGTPEPAEAPEPAPAVDAEPAPAEAPADEGPPPAGKIGGDPILPKPVVMGAIANAAVEEGIGKHLAEINKCWETEHAKDPKLRGKVLVKFAIGEDGTVQSPKTQSTSLRHAPTEDCVVGEVAKATFPPLEGGKLALVRYPFVFPPPE